MSTALLMYIANSYFFGIKIGNLPFEPWGMVKSMSHRGLTSENTTDFSLVFIYMLSNMAFRGLPGKLFGNDGPRMPIDH